MAEEFLSISGLTCDFTIYSSLKGISFSLARGENLVIFGTENSGVDGICSVIAGLHPYQGEISFMGRRMSELSPEEMNHTRRDLVYMQRNYGLISNMTVEENIALPLRYHTDLTADEIDTRVDGLIEDLHLDYCRDMRPIHLKPSEVMKTSYCRSVGLDPALLLIEHPLEGQCLINTLTFLKNLKKRCSDPNNSVVIITYEPLRFIEFAQRFIMLDYGKIVFDGGVDVMQNPSNEFAQQYLGFSGDGPMQIL